MNEGKTLIKCLGSIERLNYPAAARETIVIDCGSTDNTLGILEKSDNIKLLRFPGAGPSEARNKGIVQATGDFVAFTDGDCAVDSEWLNELLKGFMDEKVMGSGGSQHSPEDERYFGRCIQEFFRMTGFLGGYIKNHPSLRKVSHNPACNSMYRREVFGKAGYFREGLWPGEDVELDYRIIKAGFTLAYNPRAAVYHYRPGSLKGFSEMMYNYGKCSGGYLTRKYGFFRNLSYEPVIFFLGVLAMLLFAVRDAELLFFSLYAGVALLWVFLLFKIKKTKNIFIQSLLAVTALVCWNIGFLKGYFSTGHE